MLNRYWFVTYPENRFGPKNFGVTAFSKDHARKILIEQLTNLNLKFLIENLSEETEVIQNIDIRLLDPLHVTPNMGTVTIQGVWYPNLNMR